MIFSAYHLRIWEAACQLCWQNACQISQWLSCAKPKYLSYETPWNLVVEHLTSCWYRVLETNMIQIITLHIHYHFCVELTKQLLQILQGKQCQYQTYWCPGSWHLYAYVISVLGNYIQIYIDVFQNNSACMRLTQKEGCYSHDVLSYLHWVIIKYQYMASAWFRILIIPWYMLQIWRLL